MRPTTALLRRRLGASTMTYAILVALVSVGAIGAVSATGGEIERLFGGTSDELAVQTAAASTIGAGQAGAGSGEGSSRGPSGGEQPSLAVSGGALPVAVWGQPYSAPLDGYAMLGGGLAASELAWTLDGGALPQGLAVDSGSVLTGTPTEAGTFSLSLGAAAREGALSGRGDFTLEVEFHPQITLDAATPPAAQEGQPYRFDAGALVTASGGASNDGLTWAVIAGALPRGLALDPSTGIVEGTPEDAGETDFTLEVLYEDASAAQAYTIAAADDDVLALAGAKLARSVWGEFYSASLADHVSVGGDVVLGDLAWSFDTGDGTKPSFLEGLDLDPATGVLSGTPSKAYWQGSYVLPVKVTGRALSRSAVFTIPAKPAGSFAFSGRTYQGRVDGHFSEDLKDQLTALSGVAANEITWRIVSGRMPDGLVLDAATGVISGTPETAGSNSVEIRPASKGSTWTSPFEFVIGPRL